MKKVIIVFTVICFLSVSFIYSNDNAETKIKQALEFLKKGNKPKTIELLAEAIMYLKNQQELSITNINLCNSISSYRNFEPKQGFTINEGDVFLLYFEPAGYKVVKTNKGYMIWISQDVKVENDQGKIVFEKKGWVETKKAYATPNIPFYITNRITQIPKGNYTYKITIVDHNKKTFANKEFKFTVK